MVGPVPRVGAWAKRQWRDIRWKVINLRPPASDITQGLTLLDLQSARELIRSGFVFPFGHPMPGHVYVRHPVERSRFLCFAQFHEQILTEKATEGARLLLALGARDITVEWDTSSGKKAKGEIGVELPELGRIVESVGFSRGRDGRYAIAVRGARAGRRPIPDDLVWRGDKAFQLAIEGADSDPETFDMVISSTGQNVVNAEVTAPLKAVNLKLGGTYRAWENVRFVLHATYRDGQGPGADPHSQETM